MAVQKSYKERMADIAKHRAEMKVKRAAAKKAKAAKSKASAEKKAVKTKELAAKRKALKERRAKKAGPVYKAPKYKGAPSPSKVSKPKPKSRVRKGAVSTVKTKGGDYPVYKAESKPAKSFKKAFADAKGKDFTWDGRKYSGKKAAPKKVAPKKVAKPDVRELVKNVSKKATVSPKPKEDYPAPFLSPSERESAKKKDVGGKDAWKAPADKYRQKKQLGGMVEPPTTPSISPSPAYEEGGKVSENNPYGWPSRDARNGGKK